jgi:hypothetical protein
VAKSNGHLTLVYNTHAGEATMVKRAVWEDDPEIKAQADAERAKANGHSPSQFKLVRFNDIVLDDEPNYVVEGWIPTEGLVVVWGPKKCGKSFWAFDLGMHVAMGWEYRGKTVMQGSVVYVACEGARGLKARKEAYRMAKLDAGDDPPFYLLPIRLDLVRQVQDLGDEIELQSSGPHRLIIIDTLNRSLVGSENSDQDMGDYVKAADMLRERFHCTVVIIHHCGNETNRPRGHTSLVGAADAIVAVKRDSMGQIITTLEWMKDGPEGEEIVSRLDPILVGRDKNGVQITSCVVEAVGGIKQAVPKTKPLSPQSGRVLSQLQQAIAKDGARLPTGASFDETDGVTMDVLREYCYRSGTVTDSDNPATKQRVFKRAVDELVTANAIKVWDNWVWSKVRK